MKKIFLTSISVLVIVSAIVAYGVLSPALSEGKDTDCDLGNGTTAINAINSNFTSARVPRWKFVTDKIGTQSPELKFGSVTIQAGSYFVPFTAKGPDASVNLFGMMDCKNHKIEYSIQN